MNLLYMIRSVTSSSKIERLWKSDIKKERRKDICTHDKDSTNFYSMAY